MKNVFKKSWKIGIIICLLLSTASVSFSSTEAIKLPSNFISKNIDVSISEEFAVLHKLIDEKSEHNSNFQLILDEEINFYPPYDDEADGTAGNYDPAEWDKWDAGAIADKTTGKCEVWSTCAGAQSAGWMSGVAGVCGKFTATEELRGVKLNLYCLAKFMVWCGNSFSGYSEYKIMYIFYENGEIVSEKVLQTYKKTSGGEEYYEDFTNDPITANLANIHAGSNYEIWIWAFAKTYSDGGGYSSYVDGGVDPDRYMKVTKIKLTGYPPSGWLEIDPSSYNFGTVSVGQSKDHTFKVKNTGDYPVHNIVSKILWGGDYYSVVQGGSKDYLAPGDSYDVVVRFKPNSKGTKSGELVSQGDHTNVARASLSGTCSKTKSCCYPADIRTTILMKLQNVYPIFQHLLEFK